MINALLDRLLSRFDARPPLETEAVFEGLDGVHRSSLPGCCSLEQTFEAFKCA